MLITMSCPSCGKNLSAPDSSSGKKAKCPACGQIMIVPDVRQNAEETAEPAQPPTPFGPEPATAPAQN